MSPLIAYVPPSANITVLNGIGIGLKRCPGDNKFEVLFNQAVVSLKIREKEFFGVEVITQATLSQDSWMGKTDILIKVEGKSKFGNWSYEVQDTKLSQNTRASTILQLCLYTDLLNDIQGSTPRKMYVVKPGDNFPTEEFLFTDFQAYYRLVKKNFEHVINAPPFCRPN